jgi:hypothetical protein
VNEQVTAKYLKRKFANDPRMQELIDYINRAVFYLYQEYRNTGTSTDAELVWKRNIVDLSVKMVAALGHGHELHGNLSTILGNYGNITRAYRETILGSYATDMPGNFEEWEIDDRLLEIGKGTDADNRAFALRIYKSGLTMLSNALLIGAFETGELEPVDGMIQFADGNFKGYVNGWKELAFKINGLSTGFISKNGKWFKVENGLIVAKYDSQLVFEYTSASAIPAGANTVEFWNTQLNLPVNGTSFIDVVVVDNLVNLIGGSGITLISPETLTTGQTSGLISVKDYIGCLLSISEFCFAYESEDGTGFLYFRKIYSETIVNVENWAFYGANGVSCFTNEYEFYLPNVPQLGDSALFNEVFTAKQSSKIKLWVHPDALICNDGAPDADISYLTNVEINPSYNPFDEATYITKSDLTKDFQVLIAKDITPGTAQTYELILKAREGLNVDSLIIECDDGTLTGCQLIVGSTAVSLDSATTFTISTTQVELTATSNFAIAAGNLVKLVTSTGYTGTPTTIKVQLNYSKQV